MGGLAWVLALLLVQVPGPPAALSLQAVLGSIKKSFGLPLLPALPVPLALCSLGLVFTLFLWV
jgi:hypothetical protein